MAKLPDHLFVSDSDGSLYDTRIPNWHKAPPLRANYRRAHRDIQTFADVKATLRAGPYTFPGCYPLYFIMADGGALSFAGAEDALHVIAEAMVYRGKSWSDNSWVISACDINYEDNDLYCSHTNEKIESAYGDDDTPDEPDDAA